MSRATFPDTPISAKEMAQSIRREKGLPEPPDPNQPREFELEIDKRVVVTIEATSEDDAEARYLQGGYHDDEEVVERFVVHVSEKVKP